MSGLSFLELLPLDIQRVVSKTFLDDSSRCSFSLTCRAFYAEFFDPRSFYGRNILYLCIRDCHLNLFDYFRVEFKIASSSIAESVISQIIKSPNPLLFPLVDRYILYFQKNNSQSDNRDLDPRRSVLISRILLALSSCLSVVDDTSVQFFFNSPFYKLLILDLSSGDKKLFSFVFSNCASLGSILALVHFISRAQPFLQTTDLRAYIMLNVPVISRQILFSGDIKNILYLRNYNDGVPIVDVIRLVLINYRSDANPFGLVHRKREVLEFMLDAKHKYNLNPFAPPFFANVFKSEKGDNSEVIRFVLERKDQLFSSESDLLVWLANTALPHCLLALDFVSLERIRTYSSRLSFPLENYKLYLNRPQDSDDLLRCLRVLETFPPSVIEWAVRSLTALHLNYYFIVASGNVDLFKYLKEYNSLSAFDPFEHFIVPFFVRVSMDEVHLNCYKILEIMFENKSETDRESYNVDVKTKLLGMKAAYQLPLALFARRNCREHLDGLNRFLGTAFFNTEIISDETFSDYITFLVAADNSNSRLDRRIDQVSGLRFLFITSRANMPIGHKWNPIFSQTIESSRDSIMKGLLLELAENLRNS